MEDTPVYVCFLKKIHVFAKFRTIFEEIFSEDPMLVLKFQLETTNDLATIKFNKTIKMLYICIFTKFWEWMSSAPSIYE